MPGTCADSDGTAAGAGDGTAVDMATGGDGAWQLSHPHDESCVACAAGDAGATAGKATTGDATNEAIVAMPDSAGMSELAVADADSLLPAQSTIALVSLANNWPTSGSNPQHPNDHTVDSAVRAWASRVNSERLRIMALAEQYAWAPAPTSQRSPTRRAAQRGHGIMVETLTSADNVHYRDTVNATPKDGKRASATNAWTISWPAPASSKAPRARVRAPGRTSPPPAHRMTALARSQWAASSELISPE